MRGASCILATFTKVMIDKNCHSIDFIKATVY
jgi:hypothetical protein